MDVEFTPERAWTFHPGLKAALLFAAGIIVHLQFRPELSDYFLFLSLVLLLLVLALVRERRSILVPAVASLLVLAGSFYADFRSTLNEPFLPEGLKIDRLEAVGRLTGEPTEREWYIEQRFEVDSILLQNCVAQTDYQILLRIPRSERRWIDTLDHNDLISIRGTFQTPESPNIPGGFDQAGWFHREHLAGVLRVARGNEIFRIGNREDGYFRQSLASVREHLRSYARSKIGGREGELAIALLLGERKGIDPSVRKEFARTGTAHVLAVSGLHVGVIAMVLFVLVSWVRFRWLRFTIFVSVLSLYVAITGAPPSILRAAIMSVVFLFAYSLGRRPRRLNTLGVAGLLLLLIEPEWIADVGFQLSFAAVAGIILLYRPLLMLAGWPEGLLFRWGPVRTMMQMLIVSLAAQLFTLPLTLYYFGSISPIAPVINLLVVPLIALGFGAAVAGGLLGFIPLAATCYGAASWIILGWGLDLVHLAAMPGWASLDLPRFSIPLMLLFGAAVLWLSLSRNSPQILLRSCTIIPLLLLLFHLSGRGDPLADSGRGFLYILPLSSAGGVAAAYHHGDQIDLWYRRYRESDSSAAASLARQLSERFDGTGLKIHDLSVAKVRPDRLRYRPGELEFSGLHQIVGSGGEFMHERGRFILTETGRREIGFVRCGDHILLQVPLKLKISRTIVVAMEPESNTFGRVIEWGG